MNGMMNMIGNAYRVYPQTGDIIQINNVNMHGVIKAINLHLRFQITHTSVNIIIHV